jgi:chromatin remodeling complex protein RSC6
MPPKQTKPKTEVTATTPAPTPVVLPPTPPTQAQEPKQPKQKKQKVDATPAAASSEETAPVSEEVVVSELVTQTAEFFAKLNSMSVAFTNLKSEFRVLERQWARELKTAQKSQAKRKRKSGNRQPSGFVKPTKISDELAVFLGKDKGSEMARTEVTRLINGYIRSNSLQDKDNGRKINPDAKLQKLLKLQKSDELTYFNLQKYMKPHFSTAAKPTTA